MSDDREDMEREDDAEYKRECKRRGDEIMAGNREHVEPIASLLSELDELHAKVMYGPLWLGTQAGVEDEIVCASPDVDGLERCLFKRNPHYDDIQCLAAFLIALRNAWPRLRDALDDAREVCEDVCNERDALKAENEALREVAAAAERLNASRGCDCCAGDDYYPSVTALDAALAKWKEMGRG